MEKVDEEEKRGQAAGHLVPSLQRFEEPQMKAEEEAEHACPPLRPFHTHFLLLFAIQSHC